MSRLIVTLVILLIAVAGLLYFLQGRATERPTSRIETPVTLNSIAG